MSQPEPKFPAEFLRPRRYPDETLEQFQNRRRMVNRALDAYLKGVTVTLHEGTAFIKLAMPGEDPKVDELIMNGQIRDVQTLIGRDGKQFRIGRNKGKPYLKKVLE